LRSDLETYIRIVLFRLLFLLILLNASRVTAQIHAELEGEELYNAVIESYKPNFVEVYSAAREIMFREIYNVGDSVEGIYSGHKLYLPQGTEYPIQYLATNGTANGINTEHIYPRSKGAKEENGNAFSDMHNLAPSRWAVNEARSNFPFGEINDTETDRWYKCDQTLNSPNSLSSETIRAYAEVDGFEDFSGTFEPRENAKGDIARSVFYFYTMYRQEALDADADFFSGMQSTLCAWHNQDSSDTLETQRTVMKGIVSSIQPGNYRLNIYLLSGQLLYSLSEKLDYFNTINMWNAQNGMHIIQLINIDTGRKYSGTFTVVK